MTRTARHSRRPYQSAARRAYPVMLATYCAAAFAVCFVASSVVLATAPADFLAQINFAHAVEACGVCGLIGAAVIGLIGLFDIPSR